MLFVVWGGTVSMPLSVVVRTYNKIALCVHASYAQTRVLIQRYRIMPLVKDKPQFHNFYPVMTNGNFYAVAAGRSTGVFTSLDECQAQVYGYSGCKFKKFKTYAEAQAFVDDFGDCQNNAKSDFTLKRAHDESTVTDETIVPAGKKRRHNSKETNDATSSENEIETVTSETEKVDAEGVGTSSKVTQPAENSFHKTAETDDLVTHRRTQDSDPDPKDPNTLVAFCDGSALGNGQRSDCRAGYACIFPHCEEWNAAKQLKERRTTNNRAEYMAALEAIKRANMVDPDRSRVLYIFSDSMVVIRSMTEEVGSWQTNNWKKSTGASVQDRDLLEKLVTEIGGRSIRWTHVKAHTGKNDWKSKWNAIADSAARDAASSVDEV